MPPKLRATVALSLIAVAALAGSPARAATTASIPDPLALGPDAVYQSSYDTGTANAFVLGLGSSTTVFDQEADGDVFIPSGPGPFPVLLFEHGRHSTCTVGSSSLPIPEEITSTPCPQTAVTSPIDSYAGYDYLGQNLASHGYFVISIDANAINDTDSTSNDAGALARAQLIAKSLDLVAKWNTAAGPTGIDSRLIGKLDMSRIGVMGHSRGGEGANMFATYNQTRPMTAAAAGPTGLDYGPHYSGVKAIFALAPIDAVGQSPVGYAMGSLVPYCDGDVYDLEGTRPFEREAVANSAAGYPSVLFGVQGTDHNYYNTTWTNGDTDGGPGDDDNGDSDSACGGYTTGTTIRLTAAEERNMGILTIGSFMRRYVGGETAFDPLMTGAAHVPADVCPTAHAVPCDTEMQTSYIAPKAQRHVVYTPGATSDVPVSTSGFTTATPCTPSNSGTGCPAAASGTDTAFTDYSTTAQEHLVFDGPATLTASLASAADESAYSVLTLRMAASYADTARNPQKVTQNAVVTLTDAAGHSASVNAADYAAGTLYPERTTGGNPEMVLGDVRVPLAAFAGVDTAHLAKLTLGFGTLTGKGNVDLADVAFQEPAAATPPPAALPEAPQAALLVLAGLGVVGATAMFRRRRTS